MFQAAFTSSSDDMNIFSILTRLRFLYSKTAKIVLEHVGENLENYIQMRECFKKTPQNFPMHLFVPISEILDSEQMSTKLIYEECTSQNSKNGSMKKKFRLLLWEKTLRLMPKEKKLTNSTRKFK